VLAAAQESADGEVRHGGGARRAERRKPSGGTDSGDDIGLFYDFAQGAQVRESVDGDGSEAHGGQAEPGAAGEDGEDRLAVQLLEESEKPIGGRPCQKPRALRTEQDFGLHEPRLQKINAEDEAEGRHLQERRYSEQQAAGEELRGQALDSQSAAEDECAARQHGEPVGGVYAKQAQDTGGGGELDGTERERQFADQPAADVMGEQLREIDQSRSDIGERDDGKVAGRIE